MELNSIAYTRRSSIRKVLANFVQIDYILAVNKLHILFLSLLVFALLSYKLTQPFWGHHEFNGVFYGMIAKNYLRYGILQTRGAQVTNLSPTTPSQWSFHTNHPATFPLLLSLFFALFGPYEYVSRLISIVASIVAVVVLGRLISSIFQTPLSWLAAVLILFSPLFLYYGSLPVFEPILFPVVVFGLYIFWKSQRSPRLVLIAVSCILASVIDWPGFWLPVWLIVYELATQKRKRVLLTLLGSIAVALAIILTHQLIAYGSLESVVAVGRYRLGVTSQPYTPIAWLRLLLSRTRAFLGLPIIIASAIGFVVALRKRKRQAFFFLAAALGIGISHIFVFRNVTWYHDYMLYHLLPFVGLALGSLFHALYVKTRSALAVVAVFSVIVLTTVSSTHAFFTALVNLTPHEDCVEMGYQVRRRSELQTFQLTSEKAKECPPFIGFYGEKPFEVKIKDQ